MGTINERVKEIRKYEGLTLEKFGEPLGVKKAAISGIETGKRGVTDQMIAAICNTYFVSEEWLRTGKGSMHREELDDIYLTRWTARVLKDSPCSFQHRFASVLSRLSIEEWAVLEKMCIEIVKSYNHEQVSKNDPYSDIPYTANEFNKKYFPDDSKKNGKTG
jgi:transcriptional regulator with XRE-family HTH domain